jgi:hypothetical protein
MTSKDWRTVAEAAEMLAKRTGYRPWSNRDEQDHENHGSCSCSLPTAALAEPLLQTFMHGRFVHHDSFGCGSCSSCNSSARALSISRSIPSEFLTVS